MTEESLPTSAPPGADLDHKLLAAVERLGRAVRSVRQATATRHGLSVLGVQVLELLSDGCPRRTGVLAAELDITPATMSEALSTLVDRALVSRAPDPADRRASLLTLTPEGEDRAQVILKELSPLLPEPGVDRRNRGTALRVLLGEIARLQADGLITVSRNCLTCQNYQPPDAGPARCLLLGTELADPDLRVDCPEHTPTPGRH